MTENNRFVETVGKISVFLGKTCGMFYLTAIGLSVFEVFMRYAVNAPTAWTTETVMTLCATAWLLCVGAVTQQRRHITVTVLEIVVGEKNWKRLVKIATVISMFGVGGLLWAAWGPGIHSITHLERSGSAFNPPVPSYLKVMLVLACTLYFLQLIANLIEYIGRSRSHADNDLNLVSETKE